MPKGGKQEGEKKEKQLGYAKDALENLDFVLIKDCFGIYHTKFDFSV